MLLRLPPKHPVQRWILCHRVDNGFVYLDDFELPRFSGWDLPGEAVALFEILERICRFVGFPGAGEFCPKFGVTRVVILPLLSAARFSQHSRNTPRDFHPYDGDGRLVDPSYFLEEKGYMPWFWSDGDFPVLVPSLQAKHSLSRKDRRQYSIAPIVHSVVVSLSFT